MIIAWKLASVPFWVCGIFCFGAAIYALIKVGQRPSGHEDANRDMLGSFTCILIAMATLPIAAWLVTRGGCG